MKKEVLGACPVCDHELKVTELSCGHCQTKISGKFDLCKFCKLADEQKVFVEVFLKNRGNIKEIEKELKISYPTVRNKLDEVIGALGYQVEKKNTGDKKDVPKKLSDGEISKEEAVKLLSE